MSGKRTQNTNAVTAGVPEMDFGDDTTEETAKRVHQMVGQALKIIGDELNLKYNKPLKLARGQSLSECITRQRVKQVFKDDEPWKILISSQIGQGS